MRIVMRRQVPPPIERARRCAVDLGKVLIFEGITVDDPNCIERTVVSPVTLRDAPGFEARRIRRCVPPERFGLRVEDSIRHLDREMLEPFLRQSIAALKPEDVEKGLKEASCP